MSALDVAEPGAAASPPIDEVVKNGSEAVKAEENAADVEMKEATKVENGDSKVKNEEVKEEKGDETNGVKATALQFNYPEGMLKTSSIETGAKFNADGQEVTSDPVKIRNQVEFYLGDANLQKSEHMFELITLANNPVKLAHICSFGRMKRFQPYSAVVAALKQSKFLEVSGADGEEEIKRKRPYDPTTIGASKVEARSIYVKGFGDEVPSTQFDIEAFFSPYGSFNEVRLRRMDKSKSFKGSVFVEWTDEETAKKFLALDPKPLWKGEHPLYIVSKKEYCEIKQDQINKGLIEPAQHYPRGGRRGGRGGRGGRGRGGNSQGRGDRDPNDWKKRREDDRASGFKNNNRGRGGNNNRGRGGGRGGGAHGGRDNRAPRNNDRNEERAEKQSETKADDKSGDTVVKDEVKAADTPANNEKKRAREDDAGGEEHPAKKVDTKSE